MELMQSGLGCFSISEQFLLFTKHSHNTGLRENSHIFVLSSFLTWDLMYYSFDLHVFQTMLYTLLIRAYTNLYFTIQIMQASHVSIFLKHLLVLK